MSEMTLPRASLPQLVEDVIEQEIVGPVADIEEEEDDGEEPHGNAVDALILVGDLKMGTELLFHRF